ncbi:MAG TPA: hypothetical protein VNF68_09320 [Candidatus Baltobacteraceae bacterium]|nr:hypothetical protein [Candidatus Baltobacteraceae bacterium]
MTNRADVVRGHARLHETAAALFRALDAVDVTNITSRVENFLSAVETHLRLDATLAYRLLLRHPSDSVHRVAERILTEQEFAAQSFEGFKERWRGASPTDLLRSPFRDELETIVSSLLQRIRAELRLFDLLSGVA